MIPTMTPVSAMPSSTRLTPTFTPPNTKSIAIKNTPALQQRQGLTAKTLLILNTQIRTYMQQATHGATQEARQRAKKLLKEKKDLLNYYISLLKCWDWLYDAPRAELRKHYKDWLSNKKYSNRNLGGFNAINAYVSSRTSGKAKNELTNFQRLKNQFRSSKTLNARRQ